MLELKCQHCGETFVAKLARAKWCSLRCGEIARYEANRESILEKQRAAYASKPKRGMLKTKCRHCGEAFATKRNDAKWCSDKCSRRGRGKILGCRSFVCQHCGENFSASRIDVKWCSGRCAQAFLLAKSSEKRECARERSRKWAMENPEKYRQNMIYQYNKAASANAFGHAAIEILKLNGVQNDQPE